MCIVAGVLVCHSAQAQKVMVDNIYYNLDVGNKTASVTFAGENFPQNAESAFYSGEVTIPATFVYQNETYTVTSIGERAFYYCTGLTAINLPNSITRIENVAFQYAGITEITLPDNISQVGNWTFGNCANLTTIRLPAELTSIGERMICFCPQITELTIPAKVTGIAGYGVSDCANLKEVTLLGNSVKSLGGNNFSNKTVFHVSDAVYNKYLIQAAWNKYTITPQNVSTADMKTLSEGKGLLNSAFTLGAELTTGTNMLSNSPNVNNGIANLVDNNAATYVESWNSYPANGAKVYIQVDLGEPIQNFITTITPRNWYTGDTPISWTVLASNDGDSWVEAGMLWTDGATLAQGVAQQYGGVAMNGSYSKLRFVADVTFADRETDKRFMGISEFHVFKVNENSTYFSNPKAYDALAASLNNANKAIANSDYSNFATIINNVANADLATGDVNTNYYYIVNGLAAFQTNTGHEKAMYVDNAGGTLKWGNFDPANRNQIFEVKKLINGNYIIRNYGTGAYITAPANTSATSEPVLTSANIADAIEQKFTVYTEGEAPVRITSAAYNVDYHPQGHSSGGGSGGNIVGWNASASGDLYALSTWEIRQLTDEQWQVVIGDKIKSAINDATCKLAEVTKYTQSSEALINSDASNLSTNAASLNLEILVNGNLNETTETWSNYPASDAYLQVDLTGKNIRDFYITIAPRTGNEQVNDTPKSWIVTASNDGTTWDYITEYQTIKSLVKAGNLYTYPVVSLGQDYQYVRFTSPVAIKNRTENTRHFALGEFQLYEAVPQNSLRYDVSAEAQVLSDALNDANTALNGNAANTDIKIALSDALADFETALSTAMAEEMATLDGKFLRIRSANSNKQYLLSTTATTGQGEVLTAGEGNGKEAIFFSKDGKLLSYAKGCFVKKNGTGAGFASIATVGEQGADIDLLVAQNKYASYAVRYAGSRFIHVGVGATSINGANSEMDANCDFYVEEVNELPITMNEADGAFYGTINLPVAVVLPAGLKAYGAQQIGESLKLTKIAGDDNATSILAANTPAIIVSDNDVTSLMISTETGVEASDNALNGTVESINVTANDNYVLSGKNGVGFYKYNNTVMPGFKAYLNTTVGANKFAFIFDDDDLTAIAGAVKEAERTSTIYDIQGRKVVTTQKGGIYIQNGKKIVY